MRELIHIGNFKRKSNKVLTGYNAKMFVNGKEVGHFNGIDYSIDRDISAIYTLENSHPKEIVQSSEPVEFEVTDFKISKDINSSDFMGFLDIEGLSICKDTQQHVVDQIARRLSADIEKDLFEGYGQDCSFASINLEGSPLTIETLKETAKMYVENFGIPDRMFPPLGIAHEPLKIDWDSIKTEIRGNEWRVDMNMMLPNPINFIPLNISIDNLSIAPVKELVHIGNFEDIT